MLDHSNIWNAIETIARMNGLSPSGLAKEAGLDPTAFNKSKRKSPNGKERWPTTQSIAKILSVTNMGMGRFAEIMQTNMSETSDLCIPATELSGLLNSDTFLDKNGKIKFDRRTQNSFKTNIDSETFAIKIISDDFKPLCENGDVLMATTTGGVRKGDMVVIAKLDKTSVVGRIVALSPHKIKLANADELESFEIPTNTILWKARVIWKSIEPKFE